jgi:hypothetical protein
LPPSFFKDEQSIFSDEDFFRRQFRKFPKTLFARDLHDDWLAFAFAALREPRAKSFGETLGREPEARFDSSFCHGKRVIKIGGVGKVAHAELIEPFERAGASLAADHHVDVEFLRVHARRKRIRDAAIRPADYEVRGRFTE